MRRVAPIEILGLEESKLVDVPAVLRGFDDGVAGNPRETYLSWIRQIAELRWLDQGIRHLPWWQDAENLDEVASSHRHPEAKTFDNRPIDDDDRVGIEIEDFIGLRSTDVAHAIEKHPTSVARWINIGFRKQVDDDVFRERIDNLDRRISASARNKT